MFGRKTWSCNNDCAGHAHVEMNLTIIWKVPAELNVLVKECGVSARPESHNPLGVAFVMVGVMVTVPLVVECGSMTPPHVQITVSLTAMLVVAGVKTSPVLPTNIFGGGGKTGRSAAQPQARCHDDDWHFFWRKFHARVQMRDGKSGFNSAKIVRFDIWS